MCRLACQVEALGSFRLCHSLPEKYILPTYGPHPHVGRQQKLKIGPADDDTMMTLRRASSNSNGMIICTSLLHWSPSPCNAVLMTLVEDHKGSQDFRSS